MDLQIRRLNWPALKNEHQILHQFALIECLDGALIVTRAMVDLDEHDGGIVRVWFNNDWRCTVRYFNNKTLVYVTDHENNEILNHSVDESLTGSVVSDIRYALRNALLRYINL